MAYTYIKNNKFMGGDPMWNAVTDVYSIVYDMEIDEYIKLFNNYIDGHFQNSKRKHLYKIIKMKDLPKTKGVYLDSISWILEHFDEDFMDEDSYVIFDRDEKKFRSFTNQRNMINYLEFNQGLTFMCHDICEEIVMDGKDFNMPQLRDYLSKLEKEYKVNE